MSNDKPWSDLDTKTTPIGSDILAILDSEDTDPNTKNKIITISSIPGLTGNTLNDLLDVTITSQKLGDVLFADSTTSWANLNPGVDGQVLTLAGGVPSWSNAASQTPWQQDIDGAGFQLLSTGNIGIETANPESVLNVSDVGGTVLNLMARTTEFGVMAVQGHGAAFLWLVDLDAPANERLFSLISDNGKLEISETDDDFGNVRSFLSFDHNTHIITVNQSSDYEKHDIFNTGNIAIGTTDITTIDGNDFSTVGMINVRSDTSPAGIFAQGQNFALMGLIDLNGIENERWFNIATFQSSTRISAPDDENASGGISGLRVCFEGSDYTDGESVTLTGLRSGSADWVGTVSVTSGAITAFNATSNGTNYINDELISVIGGTSGTDAIAYVKASAGVITSFRFSSGTGYNTPSESATLTGTISGGNDATGDLIVFGGKITNFALTEPGSGYQLNEPITITGDTSGANDADAILFSTAAGAIFFELDHSTGLISVTQNMDMSTLNNIINMADPTNAQDAATKNYVDIQGFLTSAITSLNTDTVAAQTLSGTLNRITVTDSTPDHAFDIAATYVGQASITTLGTITTGIWNGTAVTYVNLDISSSVVNGDLAGGVYAAITGLGTQSQVLDMGTNKIISLDVPTLDADAATKKYVDDLTLGLIWHDPARIASTGNLTLSGLAAIDGITPVASDRILAKDQSDPIDNGIYVAAAGAWSRASDMATSSNAKNATIFIEEGTTNGGAAFTCTSDPAIVGTDALNWTEIFQTISLVAGDGLSFSGDTLNVGGTTNRIDVSADNVDISTSYVGQASITTLGTITTGIWNGTALRMPASATPSVTVDGDIAFDTTVTDFSTGLIRFFGGEEQGLVTMPIAQFTSPSDGFVVSYNATNDEFELVAQSGGDTLPVDDTTSIVQDPVTNSKQMRIDVGAVSDSTVRVLTMPDADVNLGGLTNSNLASGVFAAITGIGTQTQQLVMGSNNITGVGDIQITATNSLFLDGGTDTFLKENASDDVQLSVGGVQGFEWQEVGTEVNSVVGKLSQLATTATDGFLHIPTVNGTPTGTPTNYAGKAPLVYDSTNDILYIFNAVWVPISGGSSVITVTNDSGSETYDQSLSTKQVFANFELVGNINDAEFTLEFTNITEDTTVRFEEKVNGTYTETSSAVYSTTPTNSDFSEEAGVIRLNGKGKDQRITLQCAGGGVSVAVPWANVEVVRTL